MSQAEAAAALGVSRSALNAWENDRAYPRSSIGALEELYGITLDGEPDRPPPTPLDEALGEDVAELVRQRLRAKRGKDAARLIRLIEEEFSQPPSSGADPAEPGARQAPR